MQFVIRAARDAGFERRGSDLHHNATISLVEALVGFTTHVRISLSPGLTPPGWSL